ncbi:hypothetical protein [Vibrio breoganii]|uniref:hypothetical protein n=1 Tax=Vibrio breoganii TaxID=553239 RepID=UPI0002F397F6|nr:hypothetical protein [Vibrio breoganii]OEF87664.1 hypothetical protein B003_14795 [Vibrio breoganii 1C10]
MGYYTIWWWLVTRIGFPLFLLILFVDSWEFVAVGGLVVLCYVLFERYLDKKLKKKEALHQEKALQERKAYMKTKNTPTK